MTTHFIGTSHLISLKKSLAARQAKSRIGNFNCYWANNSIFQKPMVIGVDDSNIAAMSPALIESWKKSGGSHIIKINEGDTIVFCGFANPIPEYAFLTDVDTVVSQACHRAWLSDALGISVLPASLMEAIVSMPVKVFILDAPLWGSLKIEKTFKKSANPARYAEFISHYEEFCNAKGIIFIRQPSDTLEIVDKKLATKVAYLKDDGYHLNEDGANMMSAALEAAFDRAAI